MDYAEQLLNWFDKNKREMPWRKTSDPYGIWVSEIMLQQTQVDTVIPYYERFMERFPTVHSLASSSLEEVHQYWQGLGYYRRAENLHKGAKMVDEVYGGVFPREVEKVKKIPGIGDYTLGAILSIAFHIPLPAVDGNVMRILSRQFLIDADIAVAKNRKLFERQVMRLMPTDPNRFNQALMEFGALVCTPKNPKCENCPMQGLCQAYEVNSVEEYPVKSKKTRAIEEHYTVLIIKKENKYGMIKRSEKGLLANLWGFPMIEIEEWNQSLLKTLNSTALEQITHVFTHRKWNMFPVVIGWSEETKIMLKAAAVDVEAMHFVTREETKGLPVATAFKKVINEIKL